MPPRARHDEEHAMRLIRSPRVIVHERRIRIVDLYFVPVCGLEFHFGFFGLKFFWKWPENGFEIFSRKFFRKSMCVTDDEEGGGVTVVSPLSSPLRTPP
jgi:hypothetical protein